MLKITGYQLIDDFNCLLNDLFMSFGYLKMDLILLLARDANINHIIVLLDHNKLASILTPLLLIAALIMCPCTLLLQHHCFHKNLGCEHLAL